MEIEVREYKMEVEKGDIVETSFGKFEATGKEEIEEIYRWSRGTEWIEKVQFIQVDSGYGLTSIDCRNVITIDRKGA